MAFFVLMSCTSNDHDSPPDQLPPATKTGANTAGCLINGNVLIPKNGSQAIGGPALYGLNLVGGINFNAPIIGDDYWQLEIANKKDANSAGIVLWIKDMQQGVGDYPIHQSNGQLYADGPNNNQVIAGVSVNGVQKTYRSGNNSGVITVTRFDYFQGIYSGVFSCTLYNINNPSDTLQITDGRFDINVATLNQ